MLFGESDVDLVLAGLGGEVGRRAGTVSAVDARQLSLGRSLDRHRETTYAYRGTFGGDKQQACRAGLWHRHCRQIPTAYDVEEAYERHLQKILNIRQPIGHCLMHCKR